MATSFDELLDRHAFAAYERQARLSRLIGDHQWELDTARGLAIFNGRLKFDTHFIGSESTVSNTWLWADVNQSGLPQRSLRFCESVRSFGRELGVVEFARDKLALGDEQNGLTGHKLAMVATALGEASCYYRAPHDKGAVYFALQDGRVDAQPALDRKGFQEAFEHLMWQRGNLQVQIISYLCDKRYLPEGFSGDEIRCLLASGEELSVRITPTDAGGMSIKLLPNVV